MALTTLTRAPLLVHPRGVDDERVYAVVAHEILDGGKPYVDAIERKPPLLFWTYAAIFGVVGKYNWPGLHAAALLWVLATMAGLFAIGRRLFDEATGLMAAALYCIYQPWWSAGTLALNGEVLMNLPLVWGAYFVLGPSASRVRAELVPAGALFCMGFLLKQPAAIAAVPFGLYLLLPSYRRSRGLGLAHSLLHSALMVVGFFGVLGAVILLLRSQGILSDAFYWTISDHAHPYFSGRKGLLVTLAFVGICVPMILGSLAAVRQSRPDSAPPRWSDRPAELVAVVWWVAVSGLGASTGGRFFPHYFIQLIPPVALLAAPYLAGLLTARSPHRLAVLRPRAVIGWFAVTSLALLVDHTIGLARDRGSNAVGRYLQAHSRGTDRIFVWGQASYLYMEARRRPASRYINTFPLTGYIFGAPFSWDPSHDTSDRILPGAWDNLARDLSRHPAEYIVDVDAARAVPKYPIRSFPFLRDLIASSYRLVLRAPEGLIYRRTQSPAPPPDESHS